MKNKDTENYNTAKLYEFIEFAHCNKIAIKENLNQFPKNEIKRKKFEYCPFC